MAYRKLDYIVRVFVGGTDVVPAIGLSSGVCTWETANQDLVILTEDWVRGISDSVDISVSGNYAKYANPTVKIIKSKIVEPTLSNFNLSLTGSRIEVIEVGYTPSKTPIERMMFRGVVLVPVISGNSVALSISHVANYYNSQLTPAVGVENSPLVFGDSIKHVKLPVVPAPDQPDTVIGDNLTPAFVVVSQSKTQLNLRSVYNEDIVSSSDMSNFKDNYPNVKMNGENTLVGNISGVGLANVSGEPVPYWGLFITILPINTKDSEGIEYLPNTSTIILEGAEYDKIYTPYGSDFAPDNLEIKLDDTFTPFPSYIDSRVDYPEEGRIEILDADSSGDSYVAPTGVAIWSKQPSHGAIGFTRFADGVFYKDATIGSVVYSSTASLSNRDLQQAEILVSGLNSSDPLSQIHIAYEYPVKLGRDLPDALYATMTNIGDTTLIGSNPTSGIARFITVETIRSSYTIDTDGGSFLKGQIIIDNNTLPLQVLNDASNEHYRWESDSVTDALGKAIEILDAVLNDYEKETTMVVKCGITYTIDNTTDGEITQSSKMAPSIPVEYNTNEIYMSTNTGRKDIGDAIITETFGAYLSTLQLQNYETLGLTIPTTTPNTQSSGWGLQYPTDDLSVAIDPAISVRSYDLEYQTKNVSAKAVKLDLLKYTSGIGHLNNDGKETWSDTMNMYANTGYIFTKAKIKGKPTITDINPTRVYPEIGVTYANGAISIGNVEQEVYDSSYVTGVSDPDSARSLWFAGNLIYKKYKIKNTYPKKLGDITGIKTEEDAVQYIKNQYSLAGAVIVDNIVTLYKRFTASFITSQKFIWEAMEEYESFTLGTPTRFSYPHIASGVSSEVTSYKPNPLTGKTAITLECVGDSIAVNEEILIIESGTQPDTIVESGTQSITYKEEI